LSDFRSNGVKSTFLYNYEAIKYRDSLIQLSPTLIKQSYNSDLLDYLELKLLLAIVLASIKYDVYIQLYSRIMLINWRNNFGNNRWWKMEFPERIIGRFKSIIFCRSYKPSVFSSVNHQYNLCVYNYSDIFIQYNAACSLIRNWF